MGLRSIRCGVALLIVFAGVPALAAEQQYSVTHFDTVRMQVPFRVIISTGKGNSGRGEGERDALDRVSLDVSGGVLTIRAKPDRFGQEKRNPGRVTLYLTTAAVRRVVMGGNGALQIRSEEHTSELPSLMRISYAVFCLKKKTSSHISK